MQPYKEQSNKIQPYKEQPNKIQPYKKKAEITVFLSLIFLVVISFIFILIKSARVSYIRTRIEGSTLIALNSAVSEYNKMLFDKFNLLFVDTTYKGVLEGGDESFKEHFDKYFEINLYGDMSYALEFTSSDVSDTVYASDNNYEPVLSQIKYYIDDVLGFDNSSEDEILNEYIDLCISENTDMSLYEEIYEAGCDEKLEFIVEKINECMREEYGYHFDLSKHLQSVSTTVYVSDDLKVYECTKQECLGIGIK